MEDIAELFNKLESNQPQIVEEGKKTFHEFFNATKDPWLVNGVFEYFINTSSLRSIEILVGVREPHDKHLFDKLLDAMKGSTKLQALTVLGLVVRRQPTWLHKITHHPLMKELIKLLKVETDILPLMSALLVLIVLLPMIPALIGPFLPDIFEVFSRLAAWNTTNPNKLPEEQLLHLQIGLYALFHRLYGMYPCNFLSYLRHEYGQREHLGTFSHTIKPLLDTVKMHPLLVTASKDAETAATRWKKMEHHDVIVECAKFALDTCERTRDETGYQSITSSYRSRCGTGTSSLEMSVQNQVRTSPAVGSLSLTSTGDKDAWSPSVHCGFVTPPPEETPANSIPHTPISQSYIISTSPHPEGTSPPEAAIEATPETTPIKDVRPRPTPINSNVVRALNSFTSTKWPNSTSNSSTPTQSQPSSPMKKEPPTLFAETSTKNTAFEQPRRDSLFQPTERRDSLITQKVFQKVMQDRNQATSESPTSEKLTVSHWPKSCAAPPTSPLRTRPMPNSPVPVDLSATLYGKDWQLEKPKPEKNCLRLQETILTVSHDSTQEDQEVLEIVRQGEQLKIDSQPRSVGSSNNRVQRQCDSVLQEIHPSHVDEYEECEQESGSPCMSGGLHMPNSRSMLNFRRRVTAQRQRFYSQCVSENAQNLSFSTGSSPGEGAFFPQQFQVRRTNSCPEMKKVPTLPAADVMVDKTLHEKEELEIEVSDDHPKGMTNGKLSTVVGDSTIYSKSNLVKHFNQATKHLAVASTQTVDHWMPLPYEHLFLGVLPSDHNGEGTKSTAPSPAPVCPQPESPFPRFSPFAMLDKYIDTVVHLKDESRKTKVQNLESDVKSLREQVILLNIQLQFERHRREVHAERNRRLLGKSRANRSMEEHNSALRDQVALLQKAIEKLHNELDAKKEEYQLQQKHDEETISYWQNQCSLLQIEVKDLKAKQLILEEEIKENKTKAAQVNKEYQHVEKKLFDIGNEMRYALAQASIGEQLRMDVALLQREMLLLGELQQAYREQASQLTLYQNQDQDQITLLRDTSTDEIRAMHELLDAKNSSLEAARSRIGELESIVTRRDMLVTEQKRNLKQVKEKYQEQLEGVESKYRSQCALNQRLEEHILSLYNQLEQEKRIRGTRSPDSSVGSGSVAHEVSVSSAGSAAERPLGFSPHNSPLSESLGISEKLPLFAGENIGMKNLQVIVDQPEQQQLIEQQPSHSPTGEGES